MGKFYHLTPVFFALLLTSLTVQTTFSQTCNPLTTTYDVTESRCSATGSIQINASGGSGNYQYKVSGPISTNYTSFNQITGLSAGTYLVTIQDISTNCVYDQDSVTVPGNYNTPTFTMVSSNVTCMHGSDGTITVTGESFGRAPFSYQIVAPSVSAIGTVSTTGNFTGLISGDYSVQLTDSCGGIQTRIITLIDYNWIINNYNVTKIGCDSIDVTINLKDVYGNVTPNPIFNGFMYGASVVAGDTTWFTTNSFRYFKGNKHRVTLFVKDPCGNIKSVVWTDNAIPNLNANVSISNKACSTFTASVTGQSNLTSPTFCIYDANDILLSCNTSGVFDSLPYGNYCIRMTDNCYDTTITRCFTASKPVPSVAPNVNIVANCNSFTVTVTGQANLSNPNYCLYDSSDVLLYCDSTGVFSNLPFGSYCIKVTNDPACFDTTITRCFTASQPVPSANLVVAISNITCNGFTATITDTSNWNNPQFCLYTQTHVLIICNSTGVFNNLPFGTYCIDIVNGAGCYDTTITRCFTVKQPIPSVAVKVSISNRTCTTFTASITGQTNLSNPQYCLYNNAHALLTCNTTGVFTNLVYGSYCIIIQNDVDCYDTTISRCFTVTQSPVSVSISAKKSCISIGGTDIKVSIGTGIPTYTISLFSPTGALIQTITTNSSNYTFAGIPNLSASQQYKVVLTDLCGNKDSVLVTPVVSVVRRAITVTPKCPSSILLNGFADIVIDATNNNIGGNITPKIIKKDGATVSINPLLSNGYVYTFPGLAPATYIFDTYINDCNTHLYDTVIVSPYFFPDLNSSRVYQCDNGGFVINVNAVNGIPPFQYEIFGSSPSFPSILSGPQSSPVFNINNGTSYSLIRLRVVDGCGNASLKDASVLPLASFLVFADNRECFNQSLTLRVDSIENASYTWYKRIPINDSIIVGTGPSYFIPSLQLGDTGRYVCKIVVLSGCAVRIANYLLTGYCGGVLPFATTLNGTKQGYGNKLFWNNEHGSLNEYSLQRSAGINSVFQTIKSSVDGIEGQNSYLDTKPFSGNNFYRLMYKDEDGNIKYSNIVQLQNSNSLITAFPNPVESQLNISIADRSPKDYLVEINNILGQKVFSGKYYHLQNDIISIPRNPSMPTGLYSLTIADLQSHETKIIKLVFK